MPTIDEVRGLIAGGDFNQFVGQPEDSVLEVKSQGYDLVGSAQARYELAKDVAAMANAEGGYLIIGLSTQRDAAAVPAGRDPAGDPRADLDVIAALSLVPPGTFERERYAGIIREYVFPAIRGLDVQFFTSGTGPNGLGVIFIPPQEDDLKPFAIARVMEDGVLQRNIVVGYAERAHARNEPLTPETIQKMLRKGRDGTSQRLSRIEETLDRLVDQVEAALTPALQQQAIHVPVPVPEVDGPPAAAVPPTPAPAGFDRGRVRARIESIGAGIDAHSPYYVLVATVSPVSRIVGFHRVGDVDSVRNMLRDAGELRHAGFDLGIGAAAEPGPDNSLEAVQGDRKHLRLHQDGTLVFRCAADDSFMGWARTPGIFNNRPRLSPLVVVELHASFVTFYRELLGRFQIPPTDVLFAFSLRNWYTAAGQRLFITEDVPRGAFVEDVLPYPLAEEPADAEIQVTADELANHPRRVMYKLVHRFYEMFDAADQGIIPFVSSADGAHEIDVAAIQRR